MEELKLIVGSKASLEERFDRMTEERGVNKRISQKNQNIQRENEFKVFRAPSKTAANLLKYISSIFMSQS